MWELKLKSNSSKGSYRDSASGSRGVTGQNIEKIEYCLRNIKGIGPNKAKELINYSGISKKSLLQLKYDGPRKESGIRGLAGGALGACPASGGPSLKTKGAGASPGKSVNVLKADLRSLQTVNKRNIEKLYNKLTEMRRDGLIDDSFIEIWHQNINKELKVNSYRGTRHRKKYPIKGRTRSNANTRKRWKISS